MKPKHHRTHHITSEPKPTYAYHLAKAVLVILAALIIGFAVWKGNRPKLTFGGKTSSYITTGFNGKLIDCHLNGGTVSANWITISPTWPDHHIGPDFNPFPYPGTVRIPFLPHRIVHHRRPHYQWGRGGDEMDALHTAGN